MYKFVAVIKKMLRYEKENYTFLCLFVNRHKPGDSAGCTSDRCGGIFGGRLTCGGSFYFSKMNF